MSTAPYSGAVPDLGTSEVARVVGMDPNVWAFTAMKEAPGHVQHTVMAVMDTASSLDTVQRQLLEDAARAVEELNQTLSGRDTRWGGHRWTAGPLGNRATRIEQLAIRRGSLFRQLDTLLAVYQQVAAEPSPPATPSNALGMTPPAQTLPKPRAPRR
ncbi:hypothetical protein [Streptomyces sp. H34-S4]|uniref:hypothetical protein n=1 Tax=Streptomyces sp. H34-S4 TaxID=2996463 RepID=UPI00226E7A59|nr:hypothetical protein [Streptomyces sp. H34-S4]MCY0935933.1 hypothetical protein [Streptomyces sp. H34-S4]